MSERSFADPSVRTGMGEKASSSQRDRATLEFRWKSRQLMPSCSN